MPMVFMEQSAGYDWVLTPEDRVRDGDIAKDSNYPGFKLVKTLIPGDTVTESDLRWSSLEHNNAARAIAGKPPIGRIQFAIQHWAAAVIPEHVPPGSLKKVSSPDDPELGAALNAVFVDSGPPQALAVGDDIVPKKRAKRGPTELEV